jgi:hypothetical protein
VLPRERYGRADGTGDAPTAILLQSYAEGETHEGSGLDAESLEWVNFCPCHLAATCAKDRVRPRADVKFRPPRNTLADSFIEEFGHADLR